MSNLQQILLIVMLGLESALAWHFIIESIKRYRLNTMPWLIQRDNTSHCATIAVYNLCKLYDIWWLPFWAIKLMLRTNKPTKFNVGGLASGTAQEHITLFMSKVFGLGMRGNYIHADQFKEFVHWFRQKPRMPVIMSYRGMGTSMHAVLVIPMESGAVIMNHDHHNSTYFDWNDFILEMEMVFKRTNDFHHAVSVIGPDGAMPNAIEIEGSSKDCVWQIDLKKAA